MTWLLFAVLLDGEPIGTHRFTISAAGPARRLVSEASFRVTLLGFTAYRYEHQATERWRGDCLESLVSRTDDNGRRAAVDWRAPDAAGCTMSFAYWNPKILEQEALLNAQTGELEPVRVEALGEGRYRLAGRKLAIELRYDAGRWVGLETTTVGGRRLSYRLEASS